MSPLEQLKSTPIFANMHPMKVIFLEQILAEMQKQNKDSLMPFFLAVNAKASQMGIQFSDAETELIFSQLENNMSSTEKKRLQMIRSLMNAK